MKQLQLIAVISAVFIVLLFNNSIIPADTINWQCDSSIGLVEPAPVCSNKRPCTDILFTYKFLKQPVFSINKASQGTPHCGTGPRGKRIGRPVYNDGDPKTVVTKNDNITRYYCEYDPLTASVEKPVPLVIFVHGSGGYGGSMYDALSLRNKAPYYNLTDDPDRPGFVLIALQSRNLHWPTKNPQSGAKFDSYHRDFNTNPDVEYLDKVIDQTVASGLVDPERIYLMGWSNGARFTAFYGLTRHHESTPKGNKIAAIANFSGGDPYQNIKDGFTPSCQMARYPTSSVPFYMISRSCDGVACNQQQSKNFKHVTPGNVASTWIETLKTKINNPNVSWQRINYYANPVNQCTPAFLCSSIFATRNHIFWPDGVEDKTGIDWEPKMLDFLKNNPLPAQ